MAFQDFDQITERRKAENARKFKRRILIAVIAVILLIGIIVGAIFVVNKLKTDKATKKASKPASPSPKRDRPDNNAPPPNDKPATASKIVEQMCGSTDYQDKCKEVFSVKKEPVSKPKEVIKAIISGASDEAKSAFTKAGELSFEKEEEKQAFEDCKTLFDDAKEELEESVYQVGNTTSSGKMRIGLMNSWLSAVISYGQTCIDGFPDGDAKSKLTKTLEATKELTSNSLAVISLLSEVKVPGTEASSGSSRRLLAQNKDGFPSWLTHDERRVLKRNDEKPTPNVTVAKDGSGNYQSISEALSAMPENYEGRYIIYVKEGVYDESVTVTKKMPNVTIYGDGSQKSIITGNQNTADGVRFLKTATFVAIGEGFIAKSMGFRNTAGSAKQQAVAARVVADRAVFLNCRFEGYQNTLFVQAHRQFYKSSVVSGTIDFIIGDAAAIFQNCLIYIRKPQENNSNTVTAQGRTDKRETTGIVLQNCKILPDKDFESDKSQFKSYLGRPWKEYSRTIVMESTIDNVIDQEGWKEMDGDFGKKTLFYGEYNNNGDGSKTDNRVKWPGVKVLNKDEAMQFTVGPFLKGNAWLKNNNGVPVRFGLFDN
ncbi:putative pectinesterase/pectinesterase inhibitor 45 [Argentina anserina]|uniref:putative pectinesterase/pectinesterase inhibitor 45 n=1 Tax=Argentina anserina TaxID=57926 RepID=UPI0021764CB1|nr:putative pectinesterase/pectinesterase inhibitor 45 [Potentilla anserina]